MLWLIRNLCLQVVAAFVGNFSIVQGSMAITQ